MLPPSPPLPLQLEKKNHNTTITTKTHNKIPASIINKTNLNPDWNYPFPKLNIHLFFSHSSWTNQIGTIFFQNRTESTHPLKSQISTHKQIKIKSALTYTPNQIKLGTPTQISTHYFTQNYPLVPSSFIFLQIDKTLLIFLISIFSSDFGFFWFMGYSLWVR